MHPACDLRRPGGCRSHPDARLGRGSGENRSSDVARPRSQPQMDTCLTVEDARIPLSGTMKYLGLVLDGRMSFREHFKRLAPRLQVAAAALGRLLPNVGGPDVGCRRLYAGVIRPMALYGAPIWCGSLTPRNRAVLLGAQRVVTNRIVRAYRTFGREASCALAGIPPWDLDASVLADLYTRCTALRSRGIEPSPGQRETWRRQARLVAFRNWELRLANPTAGRATVEAIRPHLQQWVERRYGVLTYRLTQMLTGHGAFGHYLFRVARREVTTVCHQCGDADDTALHTLAACPVFAEPRAELVSALGGVNVAEFCRNNVSIIGISAALFVSSLKLSQNVSPQAYRRDLCCS
ncbi:uncharacterized protein LOC113508054 [Trichoplusia ni]|uniref:Uncharacterized protein LOC113508054 n=1 Tax=Trichoplusia ni TaxID=7111 RepID=A0A7E5X1I5_TRINI|nr:uncharacterized protein LOC113508054 [Trichoplusia ni]